MYERFGSGTPVSQKISALPLSLLDTLVDFDDEELEKPRELPDGTTKTLTEMSRREFEEFKRREREAIAEKEKAVALYYAVKQTLRLRVRVRYIATVVPT